MIRKFNSKVMSLILLTSILVSSCSKEQLSKANNDLLTNSKSSLASTQVNAVGEQLKTQRINISSGQGFYQDYSGTGSQGYFRDETRIVGIYNNPGPQYHMYRCKFNHLDIPNEKITNVRLNITLAKSIFSQSDPSYVQVQIPYASCNNAVSWGNTEQSGFATLKSCIENAYLVTTYSVSSGGTGQVSYSRDINSTSSPNLTALLQNKSDFTFGMFSLLTGNAVRIADISVDITYKVPDEIYTGAMTSIAGIAYNLQDNMTYFWTLSGKVIKSGSPSSLNGSSQNYTLTQGRKYTAIADIGISDKNIYYVWYKDGYMAVGYGPSSLENWMAPKRYLLPSGKAYADIVGIDYSKYDNRWHTFYKDGTFSIGSSTDLGQYSRGALQAYSLPPGEVTNNIAGIATYPDNNSSSFYVWYASDKISAGHNVNLNDVMNIKPID